MAFDQQGRFFAQQAKPVPMAGMSPAFGTNDASPTAKATQLGVPQAVSTPLAAKTQDAIAPPVFQPPATATAPIAAVSAPSQTQIAAAPAVAQPLVPRQQFQPQQQLCNNQLSFLGSAKHSSFCLSNCQIIGYPSFLPLFLNRQPPTKNLNVYFGGMLLLIY